MARIVGSIIPGNSSPVARDARLMKKETTKVLKKFYLIVLCIGLTSAITYGIYLALRVFFEVLDDANIFKIGFNFLLPVFHYTYIFCFILAYPMLATIHKCEECCMDGSERTATRYVVWMVIEHAIAIVFTTIIVMFIDPALNPCGPVPSMWAWELPTLLLFIVFAINLPRIAGTLNADIVQFHIFGYHMHESVFGIFYFCAAILLVFNARVSVVDLIFASFYFVFGGFLFGRDIKDVMAGKFIEKVKPTD